MPKRSTRETAFSMTYGTEVVIPSEIGPSSMRISDFTSKRNDVKLFDDLDLLKNDRRWP